VARESPLKNLTLSEAFLTRLIACLPENLDSIFELLRKSLQGVPASRRN
jgi:hypothetical protein